MRTKKSEEAGYTPFTVAQPVLFMRRLLGFDGRWKASHCSSNEAHRDASPTIESSVNRIRVCFTEQKEKGSFRSPRGSL
jgi:hypothetical protein